MFIRCASSVLKFGALQEVVVARERLSQKAWYGAAARAKLYRGMLYRVSKQQIRRGRREARSSTSQGSARPLCARIKDANREVSDVKAFCFLLSRAY